MKGWSRVSVAALAAGLLLSGCDLFHQVGPEDAALQTPPSLVDVTIEYWPIEPCRTAVQCDEPVVFYGSWMRPGGQFGLERVAATGLWRGVAIAVPVNFPPRGEPYEVHVYDPRLRTHASRGVTASGLVVGGERLRQVQEESTPRARGSVYVDVNGVGHNPF